MNKKAPKTILMSADTLGGVWTYATALTRSLQVFDIQVHLATFGRPLSEDQRQSIKKIKNITIHESDFKLEWMDDPWQDITRAGEWLQDLVNKIKPDIIHFNHYAHAAMHWVAPVVLVAHSCVYTWWQAVHHSTPPPDWQNYYKLVQKSLKNADCVVSISAAYLQSLQKTYGNYYNSTVIHNGITFPVNKTLHKQDFVFAMGRIWDEAKNLAILEQVAPQISWEIQAAGDAFHPVLQCEQMLKGLQHLGLLDHAAVMQKLAEASIFVAPTQYEPFGLAPLEAAANGCALVLADLPTLHEIWGDAALYFPPNDAETLSQIIQQLIDNESLRVQFSRRAQQRAQRYTAEKMAQHYYKLYKNLIQQQPYSPQKKEIIQA